MIFVNRCSAFSVVDFVVVLFVVFRGAKGATEYRDTFYTRTVLRHSNFLSSHSTVFNDFRIQFKLKSNASYLVKFISS